MKYLALNGRTFTYKVNKKVAKSRSKIQGSCKEILRQKYPHDIILEEFYVPDGFYLDFLIPAQKLAIEVQGRQHDEYVKFFHKTRTDFNNAQTRDGQKQEWCQLNKISLYRVYSIDELKELLGVT